MRAVCLNNNLISSLDSISRWDKLHSSHLNTSRTLALKQLALMKLKKKKNESTALKYLYKEIHKNLYTLNCFNSCLFFKKIYILSQTKEKAGPREPAEQLLECREIQLYFKNHVNFIEQTVLLKCY